MIANLPKQKIILGAAKMPGMVWISELGEVDPRRSHPNLYRLVPSMMNLVCRYGVDRLNFQRRDKFLVRAVIFYLDIN